MSDEFDIDNLDAQDEARLAIKHPVTGDVTTWVWTFYGPGHPATVAVADRVSREALRLQREKEQAQVNHKKWKPEEESMDEIRARTVDNMVARTKDFSPLKMSGEVVEFSPEAAKRLLLDRKKLWLFDQVYEFLGANENFIRGSAKS